jgi:hypothetical protein
MCLANQLAMDLAGVTAGSLRVLSLSLSLAALWPFCPHTLFSYSFVPSVHPRVYSLLRSSAATPDPPGGEIVRLPGGEPSGVFKDNAQDLISRVIPPLSPEQEERQALFPEFGFCDH